MRAISVSFIKNNEVLNTHLSWLKAMGVLWGWAGQNALNKKVTATMIKKNEYQTGRKHAQNYVFADFVYMYVFYTTSLQHHLRHCS